MQNNSYVHIIRQDRSRPDTSHRDPAALRRVVADEE